MHVHILYDLFLTPDGSKQSIGGIETYILNLSKVLLRNHYEVIVHQIGSDAFKKEFDGITVYGYKIPHTNKRGKVLLQKCKEQFDQEHDLLIFGSDSIAYRAEGMKSVTIQHGIFWDIPRNLCPNEWLYFAKYILKCKEAFATTRRVSHSNKLVCVDYNFINWYRAVVPYPRVEMIAIPNFTKVAEPLVKPSQLAADQPVKIMFARRFWDYRGTRIFMEAAKRILEKYDNVDITLAGDGPDEDLLKQELDKYPNVHFITYASDESLDIHADKDIAVVPTLASEGTSLSLLEAMSAQCAVVCTNVGGMTNIVINGYNGLMINPDEDSLYTAMAQLIEDAALRKSLSEKAYDTIVHGFSFEQWSTAWENVIRSLEEG